MTNNTKIDDGTKLLFEAMDFQKNKSKGEYIPPRFRVKDPLSNNTTIEHPMYTLTSSEYGKNKQTKATKHENTFTKPCKFTKLFVGGPFRDNSLNTSLNKYENDYSSSYF